MPDSRRDAGADGTMGWAVVNTHPHREWLAVEHLERQNFTAYAPVIRKIVRHARNTREVSSPLFPGYVFVRIDADGRNWRPVLSTWGVRSLVRCGTRPSLVEDGLIEALRARECGGVIVHPETRYSPGEAVEITAGPFAGLVARVIEMDAKRRLIVLLDILSRPIRLQLDAAMVRQCPLAQSPPL